MASYAFLLGFFVAIGGWTATKLTSRVDSLISPPKIEAKAQQEATAPKEEAKEKEDGRRD